MHLTPSHARFLAAVRIVSFLSAVSCRYVCCYCYWGKKSQCWRPDNYKWGLYTQYCSYIRYIAAVFCVIGTCLAGRALCKAVSWQVCFPFIIKMGNKLARVFNWNFIEENSLWVCSNLVRKLKLSSQDSAPRSLASVRWFLLPFFLSKHADDRILDVLIISSSGMLYAYVCQYKSGFYVDASAKVWFASQTWTILT